MVVTKLTQVGLQLLSLPSTRSHFKQSSTSHINGCNASMNDYSIEHSVKLLVPATFWATKISLSKEGCNWFPARELIYQKTTKQQLCTQKNLILEVQPFQWL